MEPAAQHRSRSAGGRATVDLASYLAADVPALGLWQLLALAFLVAGAGVTRLFR